jgi:FAD/FMN-containing dehydrogenase
MVANNSAGEQSFRYGNVDKTIKDVKVVLRDGQEYTFGPINRKQLEVKMNQKNTEGDLYKRVYNLIDKNYDLIKNARPKVHKNSMGYNLWTAWDRETGVFDMSQLIVGSQGTLGVITDIKIAAVPKAKHTGLLLAYLTNIKHLDEIIPLVVSHNPATFEGFDDITFNLGIKYFKTFHKQLGTREWLKQQATLLSSVAKFRGHLPNIVLMIEFEGDTYQELNDKLVALDNDLKSHHIKVRTEIEGNEEMSKPFWQIRRASLTLLRQRIKNKYASAFMDDLAVDPKYVQEFLPEVRKIIKKYKLPATVAGHFGDGNFHIIPLMDITDPKEQLKLEPAMRELVPIVLKYQGTLAGEHNDGMVRGPWLPAMFGREMYQIFKEVKTIFDPMFIFNPHKKTDASWDFSMANIRKNHKRNLYK